ncbi:MAG: glycosyltransferase family 61 protein [Methylococcaceae bacterium]
MADVHVENLTKPSSYLRSSPPQFGMADAFDSRRILNQPIGSVEHQVYRNVVLTPDLNPVHSRTTAILCNETNIRLEGTGTHHRLYDLPLNWRSFSLPEARFETALLLDGFPINYGHWLTDGLPALFFWLEQQKVYEPDLVILISGRIPLLFRARFLQFLEVCGYPQDKIIFLDDLFGYGTLVDSPWRRRLRYVPVIPQATCTVKTLHRVVGFSRHPLVKHPKIREFYQALVSKTVSRPIIPDKKLFVSRQDAADRYLIDEEALFSKLKAFGFEKVLGSELSCIEAVRLFATAKIVVGVCGASLANMVFMPQGARLINLIPADMGAYWYWDLAAIMDLEYIEIRGAVLKPETGSRDMNRNHHDFSITSDGQKHCLDMCGRYSTEIPPKCGTTNL